MKKDKLRKNFLSSCFLPPTSCLIPTTNFYDDLLGSEVYELLLFVIYDKLIFPTIKQKDEGDFVGLSGNLANINIYRADIKFQLDFC
jgi:hypothetical protein